MAFVPIKDYSLFKSRREQVLDFLKREYADTSSGMIILFADAESDRSVFRQESSFYYLTGITEPGAVYCLCLDGKDVLYLPNYGSKRETWVKSEININNKNIAQDLKFNQVKLLGNSCESFSLPKFFNKDYYSNLILDLKSFVNKNLDFQIFVLIDQESSRYFYQRYLFDKILEILPDLGQYIRDLSPLIHHMRRFKSEYEIDLIYKAVQITSMAQEAAASVVAVDRYENEVQAIAESIFTQMGSLRPSFPSIIATGNNTNILHYHEKDKKINKGDLVIVDIGAEYGYYAADLTRTFPANGKFSVRQKEVYNLVLKTQEYIESIAKPGIFLNNKNMPENSLMHLAVKFLKSKGYEKYIYHGIGHYLGLDVHDVGDNQYPLEPGDVFTIEPGLYLVEENFGIRIEDVYLMTDEGAICLSYQLARKPEEIEELMIRNFNFE